MFFTLSVKNKSPNLLLEFNWYTNLVLAFMHLRLTFPPETVRRYVENLHQFIDSSELTERRSLIKSFVKEIKATKNEGIIRYTFPIPPIITREKG